MQVKRDIHVGKTTCIYYTNTTNTLACVLGFDIIWHALLLFSNYIKNSTKRLRSLYNVLPAL